jgi:hypothetical protein
VKKLQKIQAPAPKRNPHRPRACLNPNCKIVFTPGHYGERQKVGSSKEHAHEVQCGSCKGTGTKRGEKCYRCAGKGKVVQTCQDWYKLYWSQVRQPPSGIQPEHFKKIEQLARRDPLHHACLVTARESAMRKGELLGITWGDIVDPTGEILGTFNLRGQWDDADGFKPTKTGTGRVAYLFPDAIVVISKMERGKPQDRVFPISESNIYQWFVDLQKELGIVSPWTGFPYRFHDIRHTMISEIVNKGGEDGLVTAKDVAGHRNFQTTLGYARQSAQQTRDKAINLRKGSAGQKAPSSSRRISTEGSWRAGR